MEGIDGAIERANRYGAAGADVCFIEAPQSRAELEQIPRAVRYPLLVNMLSGGATPILTVEELGRLGYKIVVCPIETLLGRRQGGAAFNRGADDARPLRSADNGNDDVRGGEKGAGAR